MPKSKGLESQEELDAWRKEQAESGNPHYAKYSDKPVPEKPKEEKPPVYTPKQNPK